MIIIYPITILTKNQLETNEKIDKLLANRTSSLNLDAQTFSHFIESTIKSKPVKKSTRVKKTDDVEKSKVKKTDDVEKPKNKKKSKKVTKTSKTSKTSKSSKKINTNKFLLI
jgi:nitrous oxide reductase